MTENSDTLALGGNIELSGFKEIDPASMIVVKKIVGNYVKKISEKSKKFEKLTLKMKAVHKTPKSEKYELHCNTIIDGKTFSSEVTERNLFVGVDTVLKKLSNEMEK